MSRRARCRMQLCWPHHRGPWHHAYGPYGGPPPWWGPRPTEDDEKQALSDYIAALKEELEEAEASLKELEGRNSAQ
jgi:hypothetical protein